MQTVNENYSELCHCIQNIFDIAKKVTVDFSQLSFPGIVFHYR